MAPGSRSLTVSRVRRQNFLRKLQNFILFINYFDLITNSTIILPLLQ
ncbi:MAG: hypothetical protein GPOALKHO_000920 [Sodalis sp.]|nr:MAG: hypothetical protein GPOALKHO_000920 [Sodalis sp.]